MANQSASYTGALGDIQESDEFAEWLDGMERRKQDVLYGAVVKALAKLSRGAGADRKSVGDGVWEYRHHGKRPQAFRIYYGIVDGTPWALYGGTKTGEQQGDIRKAKEILGRLEESGEKGK